MIASQRDRLLTKIYGFALLRSVGVVKWSSADMGLSHKDVGITGLWIFDLYFMVSAHSAVL